VLDFGIDDNSGPGNEVAFMARQYLDGLTLNEYLDANGPFDPDEGINAQSLSNARRIESLRL